MTPRHWTSLITAFSVAALLACQPSGQAAEVAVQEKANIPAPAVTRTLEAWRQFSMATTATISSRTAQPGDVFTATVVADVQDAAGRVVIPEGSLVSGTITDVKSAPNPSSPRTLTLAVHSIAVRGRSYPMKASIDSLATQRSGRPISGDIRLPAGTHVLVILTQRLNITRS